MKSLDRRPAPDSGAKLFLRDEGRRRHASGFPTDVLVQSARRLRTLALLYAFVFFMAGFFPDLMSPANRARIISSPIHWMPGTFGITAALLVALATKLHRIPLSRIMQIGILFEIVSSFGIACAEFLDPAAIDFNAHWVGLSWVAIWTLLFAMVVPNSPRRTLLATLASVSSVPLVIFFVVTHNAVQGVTWDKFFFGLIFPYLLVSVMAYVGASVVYSLGREVARAREMGGYRLVERLGAGGMGEVWRAEHRLLARPAAIKLVRSDPQGHHDGHREMQLRERFGREAQATAWMRSPHTVELYDFGIANDGTFYYVMELLEGFNLEGLVQRFGPVPPERAIHLMRQTCHSLAEAHEKGLIHRDIKPANVFTCSYGREVDFVKVLDFGMVKHQRDAEPLETQLTGDHAVLGSPGFMSPEQVLGRDVDGRADLYAVGCLGYWLLTGQLVFPGGNAMEMMVKHTREEPTPPSSRTELEIPAALDEWILKCLAKDPAQRPATADALAEGLSSISIASPWTRARARAWWDRHHPVERATVGATR
jgi:serine/threonine-protein kinase